MPLRSRKTRTLLTLLTLLCRSTLTAAASDVTSSGGLLLSEASNSGAKRISYYESLSEPLFGERRRGRAAGSGSSIQMKISAFKRDFHVALRRDDTIFEPGFKVENTRGTVDFEKSSFYTGKLLGDGGGRAHGFLRSDGGFHGSITSGSDVYLLEPAAAAARKLSLSVPDDAHTIIYRHSDVAFNDSEGSVCASEAVRRAYIRPPERWIEPQLYDDLASRDAAARYYVTSANKPEKRRARRAATVTPSASGGADLTKTTCAMYLQADYLFFQNVGYDDVEAIQQLMLHVQAVNEIYSSIDFNGDGMPDRIKFTVKTIKIWDDENDPSYPFFGNYDSSSLLQAASYQRNYDNYCEAFTFTNRDFNDGTLGIAWQGSLTQDGGVCEKNGLVGGVPISMNTGVITTLSYGSQLPLSLSSLVFAHEVGHAMGSVHDSDGTSCAPGGTSGNYIMYAKSTDGKKVNNNKLSNCSISLINAVLNVKARTLTGCFTSGSVTSLCGNRVVDPGEQCDCGWEWECHEDCCVPQSGDPSTSQGTPCTLQSYAVCSPSQGPCCTGLCVYESSGVECREPTACRSSSYCTGSSHACQASVLAHNLTRCTEDGGVCFKGECTTRLCDANSLETCQCSPTVVGDYKDKRLCSLCCVDPSDNQCKVAKVNRTSGVILGFDGGPTFTTVVGSGQPCSNYSGYCDAFGVCREVNPNGPLTELFQSLFSSNTTATMITYLKQYWWGSVIGGALIIVGLGLFIKFCSRSDIDHLHKELEVVDAKKTQKPYLSRVLGRLSRRVAPEQNT